MAEYSLYETIKDKLSPRQQKILENKIKYNQLTKPGIKHMEDSL